MRVLILLLAIHCPLQDSEIQQLVDQLGDDRAEVRQNAEKKLLEVGVNALDALRGASESSDPEVRQRAKALYDRIQREHREREAITAQRTRKLRLVSIDVKDVPLRQVLDELRKQTGLDIESKGADLNTKVSMQVEDAPLIKVMDQLGIEGRSIGTAAYIEGARFTVSRNAWENAGVVFETLVHAESGVEIEWDVAEIRTDQAQPVERCTVHSPRRLYVPDAKLGEATVTVTGVRRWYCEMPMEFKRLENGERVRVGRFEIELKWPNLLVHPDNPTPRWRLENMLSSRDIQFKLKPNVSKRDSEFERTGVGRCGGCGLIGVTAGKTAWCGCRGEPSKKARAEVAGVKYLGVIVPKAELYGLSEVQSITFTFHMPVEEDFTMTTPPIK